MLEGTPSQVSPCAFCLQIQVMASEKGAHRQSATSTGQTMVYPETMPFAFGDAIHVKQDLILRGASSKLPNLCSLGHM